MRPTRVRSANRRYTHAEREFCSPPAPQSPWQFLPVKGAAGTFPTGPEAATYLPDAPKVTQIGTLPDGFLLCRYDLD